MLLQAARAYFLANSGHINLLDAEKKRINYSEKCRSINQIKTRLSIFHYYNTIRESIIHKILIIAPLCHTIFVLRYR